MLFRSDRKSTRLNSSHTLISYAVFCLKKKKNRLLRLQSKESHDISRSSASLATVYVTPSSSYHLIFRMAGVFFIFFFFFFFNDTATTEIYTLSLHDALPI